MKAPIDYVRKVVAAIESRGISRRTACWMAWDGENILNDGYTMDYSPEDTAESIAMDRPSIVPDPLPPICAEWFEPFAARVG